MCKENLEFLFSISFFMHIQGISDFGSPLLPLIFNIEEDQNEIRQRLIKRKSTDDDFPFAFEVIGGKDFSSCQQLKFGNCLFGKCLQFYQRDI